ncbi:MAG: hypothetical protein EP326_08205 [Deltaproteobacteria bacterium]|jgi:hypothetical protein|nr:MAG: hypothetical protein EP326_08205 [Deltaproteobacteria bacterium]TNF25226.1 MAG: hypothetical protein EP319_16765 [Deltaproteobacteria bacterium]
MRFKLTLQTLTILVFVFTASMGFARDYIIFSIAQDLPMGFDNEIVKKNYYVNIGKQQGVDQGTQLDVFRIVSRQDPYGDKKMYNFKVKVGELEVLHTEENSSIGILKNINKDEKSPYFEINNFMIGDRVSVKVK